MKVKRLIGAWTKGNRYSYLTDRFLFDEFYFDNTRYPLGTASYWFKQPTSRKLTSREFESTMKMNIKTDKSVVSFRRVFERIK